jgi:uncharacterized repeat protein (TIGR02059 family)
LDYAFNRLKAGDILYMRGGYYTKLKGLSSGTWFGVRMLNITGTVTDSVKVLAYNNEVPILDCKSLTSPSGSHIGLHIENCSYVRIKGLIIQNVPENDAHDQQAAGVGCEGANGVVFDFMTVRHCGNGFGFGGCNNNVLYKNCDSHHNHDYVNGGDLTNGFNINICPGNRITYKGCRAWKNSDDGYDSYGGDGYISFENCWAFDNGPWMPDGSDAQGNGAGFKTGAASGAKESGVQRVIKNCLAFYNKNLAFDESQDGNTSIVHQIYNNVSYHNNTAFNFWDGDEVDDIKNNISYLDSYLNTGSFGSNAVTNNSWQNGHTVNSAQFLTLDTTGVSGPRSPSGSLPVLNFLKLTSGSNLVDAGTSVGIPFSGTAPDLGAFEFQTGTPVQIPLLSSASVENTNPALLEMTYNLSLSNIIPQTSAFSVSINSISKSVTSVTVSGTKVQLTMAAPVVSGDVVTVTYNKPSVNPLQSSSGAQAASLTAQTVLNRVNSINPVYVSSTIENASPALLELTYNLSLASIVPAVTSFSVLVNSSSRTVSARVVSGTKVRLTLASRIVSGDKVTVSYTKPSSNYLQTSTAGVAVSISNIPVINNCKNSAPVAVLTTPVTNSSFASPANISMTASATDPDGSVSLVEFYSGNTRLGSATAAPYSFTWNNVVAGNYSLTAVVTDNQNTKTVSSAIAVSVADKKTSQNKRPVIRISNPHKGNSYANLSTITIDAIASDPDGVISKVEFYNGSSKLVEVTSAPYTYIWKDVVPGSYTVTAIATDNLNDTTKSSPVEFIVAANIKYDANSDIVRLYPNPNNGHFSIEFLSPIKNDKSEIVITDMAGKQVYNGPVQKEEVLKQFDLSGSRSGVYVMLIKDKDIIVTKKFIKN